jgi:Cu+-exporting ATPase
MPDHHHHPDDGAPKTRDPVCGMTVDADASPHRASHDGRDYAFCGAGCRTKFIADPDRYLSPREAPPAPAGTIYTCPMHPQIRQVGPGACPICGMALEPETVTAGLRPGDGPARLRPWVHAGGPDL